MIEALRPLVSFTVLTTAIFAAAISVSGEPVDRMAADHVARVALASVSGGSGQPAIGAATKIAGAEGPTLGWVYRTTPRGFLVVSADTDLPPLIAYSLRNDLPATGARKHDLFNHLRTDLDLRLRQVGRLAETNLGLRRAQWARLLAAKPGQVNKSALMQWPPAGSTATDGWLETNWHQGAPYNNACPMDPVTSTRSVAGCPSVAMAQIINYHQTTNQTSFDDSDDYYHAYAGRNYWIDDDHAAHDFSSFPELSSALSTLEIAYLSNSPPDDAGCAALTFACGVAAQQVYTSSVSGTFGVAQADQAYQKFQVDGAELLYDSHPDLYTRLSENMKHALPAHLAVVNQDMTAGHNVVVDGYNTDRYYHLNFGWGGAANGWYLLPEEIPYDLTVVEGVIVDINPSGLIFKEGFEGGNTAYWSDVLP